MLLSVNTYDAEIHNSSPEGQKEDNFRKRNKPNCYGLAI